MNGLVNFALDSKVHDTVLMTMVITSFLAAIRRIKDPARWWQVGWNFFYDWVTGFWSMRTGQPLNRAGDRTADPTLPGEPAKSK